MISGRMFAVGKIPFRFPSGQRDMPVTRPPRLSKEPSWPASSSPSQFSSSFPALDLEAPDTNGHEVGKVTPHDGL